MAKSPGFPFQFCAECKFWLVLRIFHVNDRQHKEAKRNLKNFMRILCKFISPNFHSVASSCTWSARAWITSTPGIAAASSENSTKSHANSTRPSRLSRLAFSPSRGATQFHRSHRSNRHSSRRQEVLFNPGSLSSDMASSRRLLRFYPTSTAGAVASRLRRRRRL